MLGLLAVLLMLSACSQSDKVPPALSLTGACSVEVTTNEEGAQIYVDGLSIGQGRWATTQAPCGPKQIRVEKPGYVPFRIYERVTRESALKLSVELKPVTTRPDYALSSELVAQVRTGLPLKNPWQVAGAGEATIQQAPRTHPAVSAGRAVEAPPVGVGAGPAGGTGAPPAPTEAWDSVEDWR